MSSETIDITNTPIYTHPDADLPPTDDLLVFLRRRCEALEADLAAVTAYVSAPHHELLEDLQAYLDAAGARSREAQAVIEAENVHRARHDLEHKAGHLAAENDRLKLENESLRHDILSILELRGAVGVVDFGRVGQRLVPGSVHVRSLIRAFRGAWRDAAREFLTPRSAKIVSDLSSSVDGDDVVVFDNEILHITEQRLATLQTEYDQLAASANQDADKLRNAYNEANHIHQGTINGLAQLLQVQRIREAEARVAAVAARAQAQRLVRLLAEERACHARVLDEGAEQLLQLERQNKAQLEGVRRVAEGQAAAAAAGAAAKAVKAGAAKQMVEATVQKDITELRKLLKESEKDASRLRQALARQVEQNGLQLAGARAAAQDAEGRLREAEREIGELRSYSDELRALFEREKALRTAERVRNVGKGFIAI